MEWSIIWEYREALYRGLIETLILAGIGVPGALALGLLLGCIASMPGALPKELVAYYIAPMRNLPIVVKLFFFYFIVGLDATLASAITLIMHHSAYIADITTAGYRSIPKEQVEAARACGHGYPQIFRYILLPQILRIIVPPITSQFIDVVKNSSVCMLIGVEELTFQTQEIGHITFRGFEVATAVTMIYLTIAVVIALAMTILRRAAFAK